jgi:hypothetical protein
VAGEQIDALLVAEDLGPSDNQFFDTPPGIGYIVRDPSGAV